MGRRAHRASASRIARPHPLGRARNVDMAHAEMRQARRSPRSAPRVSNRSCPTRRCPWHPSGLRGDGVSVFERFERRQLGRARHRVVGQRRGERVAVVVVDVLLPQRLRDALRDPAVLLTGHDQRVEDAAAVVDRNVPQRRDHAGVEIDFDDCDVRAERERRTVLLEVGDRDDRLAAARARPTSARVAGTPATPTRPSSIMTMSSGLASSIVAATSRACAITPSARVRAPRNRRAAANANRPCRHRSGPRQCRTGRSARASSGICSRSATIIANDVA